MHWLVFLPVCLGGAWAVAHAAVMVLIEREERQRKLRNPHRARVSFRPVLIQGGKAQAPPDVQPEARESKSA